MAFPPNVWNQLKNLTNDDIIDALKRDGYRKDPLSKDATITYIKPLANPEPNGCKNKRIVIHYHKNETCGPKLLQPYLLMPVGQLQT
jgi:predicted RNA binding protein YcfA (HicA-like mRNA interferase family)